MVKGNTNGIKKSLLARLDEINDMRVARGEFASYELLCVMAELSAIINREISIYLDRGGMVRDVTVGEADKAALPFLRVKRGKEALAGIRCIHTHPSGSPALSDADIGTLKSARLDAMAALSISEGRPLSLCAATFGDNFTDVRLLGPYAAGELPDSLMRSVLEADRRIKAFLRVKETRSETERAILIGVNSTQDSMSELERLCETAGAEAVASSVQRRPCADARYYVGLGEAKKLSLLVSSVNADLVITDDELPAAVSANLEELLGVKVVDRTALILDIFASRARTREAKLQVELAQLKYNLPRIRGQWYGLSRLGGGIGTRGPGESKLEADRRVARRRIYELARELEKISGEHEAKRETRRESGLKVVALAGYTNAGKSTLLKALTGADVLIENKLFATLTTTTRRLTLPSGREALFSDTVGFIEKLPHELIAAFRSTLREVTSADLILNVIDISNPAHDVQEDVVQDVLCELGCADKPTIRVYNKCDRLDKTPPNNPSAVFISAKSGAGLDELLAAADAALSPRLEPFSFLVPYARGDVMSYIAAKANECVCAYEQEGTRVTGTAEAGHVRSVSQMLNSAGRP